jgi:UDP-2,3-diacylglucosamine hydrolase
MRRALLADLHLGQVAGDYQRFAALLVELPQRKVGELVLAGDVFRTLVGLPRFWSPSVREALGLLTQLRQQGVRVVWVEGNRDFFLHTQAMDPYRDRFVPSYGFAAGGRRFLVEHGDLINRQDRQYRLWRTISKSHLAFWGARLIPKVVAQSIVTRTEQALAKTNFSYRRVLPEQDLVREARKHFACGVDVVFWGHFHRFWSFAEGEKQAYVLPAWQEEGTVVYIEDDGSFSWAGGGGQFVDNGKPFCYQGQEMAS